MGDSVNFEIYLQERPRVFKWNIVGVNKSEKSELIDKKLKLKRGSELSEFVINTNSDAIKKYFDEKGFQNAEVSVEQVNDTTVHNAVNVTFVVNKKSRVKIGKISFEGNEVFSDKRLRKTFKKTHQKGINIFRATKLKRKEYEEDKENLLDYYNSRGYRNAVIVKDSIYPINDKRIGISLTVDEGRKFYYRNVSWLGNSVYDTKTLNDMLGVVKGTAYDRKSLHKQLGIGRETNPEEMSVSSLYQNSGYLFSQIEPQEVVVGEDSVDLIIKVYEGKQARVNDVNFTGNYRVDDKVIRRELYGSPRRIVRPFDADGHAAPVEPDATLRSGEVAAQYRSRIQRTGRPFVPAGREGERQIRGFGRLGFRYVRRFGRRPVEQLLDPQPV